MTKFQVGMIGAIFAAGVATSFVIHHQAQVKLRGENESLRQQLNQQAELAAENERLSNLVAQAKVASTLASDQFAELLRLRGEVTRWRQVAATNGGAANGATGSPAKSWMDRMAQLKQRLEQTPGAGIPEFQFLTHEDWLHAAKDELVSETDYRRAFSALRAAAQRKFATMLKRALEKYEQAGGGQFPAEVSQLQPYFGSVVDEAILQRWAVLPQKSVPSVDVGDWIITQVAPVDDVLDKRNVIGSRGEGSTDFLPQEVRDTIAPVFGAFRLANHGQEADEFSQLLPYAKTPEQQAALQKLILQSSIRKSAR